MTTKEEKEQAAEAKAQKSKMNNFIQSFTPEMKDKAVEAYNSNQFLRCMVNAPMVWAEMGKDRSDNLELSGQERLDYTKAIITAFLLQELGKEVFDREL